MSGKRRIPDTQPEFDVYIRTVEGWLKAVPENESVSNGIRLGMTLIEITAFTAFRVLWHTGNFNNPGAYEIHCNPNGPNNSKQVVKIMKDVNAFFQPILVRMSASTNIRIEDRKMLHIADPVKHYTRKTKVITTTTSVYSVPIGAGKIKLKCIPIGSDTRGISEEADSIEIAFCIVDPDIDEEVALKGKVRKTPPANVDDIFYHEVHTKAFNILKFAHKYRGKKVYVYARQNLLSHPELAGPWSEVHILFIP